MNKRRRYKAKARRAASAYAKLRPTQKLARRFARLKHGGLLDLKF